MGNAITYRMAAGVPGAVNRVEHATITPEVIDSGTPPTVYGAFVKVVTGKIQPLASGDAGTVAKGVLVRPYPTSGNGTDGVGTSTPPTSGICDVLRRGYIMATLKLGTAAKDAQVYAVTTAGGSVVVGDIVTSASPAGGGTGVAVTNAFFTGPADAGGIVEIAYNI